MELVNEVKKYANKSRGNATDAEGHATTGTT